jgi:hypothetical protein
VNVEIPPLRRFIRKFCRIIAQLGILCLRVFGVKALRTRVARLGLMAVGSCVCSLTSKVSEHVGGDSMGRGWVGLSQRPRLRL